MNPALVETLFNEHHIVVSSLLSNNTDSLFIHIKEVQSGQVLLRF